MEHRCHHQVSLKVPLTFSSMQLFLFVLFIHSNQYLLYSIEKQMQFFGALPACGGCDSLKQKLSLHKTLHAKAAATLRSEQEGRGYNWCFISQ